MRFKTKKMREQIDLKILFNPEHEEFEKLYANEDVAKEELIMLIKLKNQS